MELVATKLQFDGSKLEKIEWFSPEGNGSGFYNNGVKTGEII